MRLRDLLFWRRRDEDLDAEIRAHLSMATADQMDGGVDRATARLAALKDFGNITLTREETRLARGETWRMAVTDVTQDIGYAFRGLRRNPGHALVIISVLTLGIGANVAIASVFKALVLEPVSGVERSGSLAVLANRTRSGRLTSLSHPDFRDLVAQNQWFDDIAGTTDSTFIVGLDDASAQRINGEVVSGNYFAVLGVPAQRGRTLLPTDDLTPGAHSVAVISDAAWRRDFGSDPNIVGRVIRVNGYPFTIVGVAAPGFRGTVVSQSMGIFVPAMMQGQLAPPSRLDDRQATLLWGIGRLRDGTSMAAAATQIEAVSARLSPLHTAARAGDRATVIPIWQSPYGAQTYLMPVLTPVAMMGGLLLFIVSANVANLVLVRGLSRRGEIAARLALGASRGRIVRLLFVEALVLATPAAVASLLIARVLGMQISEQSAAANSGFALNVQTDWFVVAFAALLACGSALLFGLVPALRATRVDLAAGMKDDLSPRGGSRGRMRTGLVVAQVAVSLVMLVGAGLVVRSLESSRDADPGFDATNVGLVSVDTAFENDAARGRAFYENLLDVARSEPGVESASLASRLPLRVVEGGTRQLDVEGYAVRRDEDLRSHVNAIASDYFRTMRIDLLAGHEFGSLDGAASPNVAIVNETMARRFWASPAAALGRRLRIDGGEWKTVVGVVSDVKYFRLNESPRPYIYAPFAQAYDPSMTLHVRTLAAQPDVLERVRDKVRRLSPNMPVPQTRRLSEVTQQAVAVYALFAGILGLFGMVALLLAALGTYGLVAYAVKQSAHEIGIRIAIGASRADVMRKFLGGGVRLAVWGGAAGVSAALLLTRLLQSLLYGVSTTDAVAFTAASATVMSSVLAASFVPAWLASRTDPMAALRRR
jgi:macrolide transport system ATP-binding/permease protein